MDDLNHQHKKEFVDLEAKYEAIRRKEKLYTDQAIADARA